jgi:hypothetical protein
MNLKKGFIFFVLGLMCGFAVAQDTFVLNLLPAAQYSRAKCLDGSQGGYYISKGDPNVVVIHFEGLIEPSLVARFSVQAHSSEFQF